jgi:endonuclease/exonuclease/phosphatase family metal-dependent hydrolase
MTHYRVAAAAAVAVALGLLLPGPGARAAGTFAVATYNLENYLDQPAGSRPAKSAPARAAIRGSIRALAPDVLAMQEMGGTNALLELRASLKSDGLNYAYWEHISAFDTNIHVAILSRFPFAARRPHTNEGFLLHGRRFPVSRGFAEVDVQVNPQYRFTLIVAHLKSRRGVPEADESELREQEAIVLREIIDARLKADPGVNLLVLGDFNDLKDSRPVKIVLGRGRNALTDTRPAELDDGAESLENRPPTRTVAWTYYFAKEDTYSRIDYILLSPGMAREWQSHGTFALRRPDWGVASDHRPIIARFQSADQ